MQQLEIQYFFPLTEQIPLDLDYTQLEKPKLFTTGTLLDGNGRVSLSNTSWANTTIQFRPSNESVGYWKVGEGLQMHNKKKPNWLHQQMTKIFFGWEWNDK